MKVGLNNLAALVQGRKLTNYQRSLAVQEFDNVLILLENIYFKLQANGAEQDLSNCNKHIVNGSALMKELLNVQQEIVSSPIRFNGVSNEDIKRIFSEHGIKYEQPF